MLTSARRGLPYPNPGTRADSADIPRDIATIINALEADVIFGQGTNAAKPVSTAGSPGIPGRLYYATDTGHLWYDYGTGWIDITPATSIAPGSITTAMLAATVPVLRVGMLVDWPWPMTAVPSWLVTPVGQSLDLATYPALHAIASEGYIYGGAGNNFNLPDLRARGTAGADNMGGTVAGRITIAINGTGGGLGAIAGAEGVVLTTAQIPAHNHGVTDPGHSHSQSMILGGAGANIAGGTAFGAGTVSTGTSATGITIQNAGGGGAHSSLQPTLFVNKLMRVL